MNTLEVLLYVGIALVAVVLGSRNNVRDIVFESNNVTHTVITRKKKKTKNTFFFYKNAHTYEV